jgi:hypothetical protein
MRLDSSRRLPAPAASRFVWAAFAVGLALSLGMVARSQVGGDQLNLLARGWLFAVDGKLVSYGNPTSTGAKAPGGMTSLLVGLPLLLWRDHRAPTLVVWASHALAFLLLDGALKRILTPRERVLFAALYWLNPWRVYFSAFLWNPNYLFLCGAVHLATALAQRRQARFGPSLLHGAMLAFAFQVHASVLLLALASLLLWWRGYFNLHWPAAALGAAVLSLPLVPWLLELSRHPAIATGPGKGFLGRGLLYVFPLVRGLLYWLRYSSLSLPEKMTAFDFTDVLGPGVLPRLGRVVTALSELLALTVVLPLLANVWLARRDRPLLRRRLPETATDRTWLHGYVLGCFVAALITFALSPTTIMMWQGVALFHAAVLPLVLWAGVLGRSRLAPWVARGTRIYVAAELALIVLTGLGATHYRCAGHGDGSDSFYFPQRYDHPMYHQLHVQQTCPYPLNDPQGWWPDVLPKPGESPREGGGRPRG